MYKNLISALAAALVFCLQVRRGLVPNAEPWVVVFSGVLSALLAGGAVRGLLALWDRWKRP